MTVIDGESNNGYHGNYMEPPYQMPALTFTDTSGRDFDLARTPRSP
ncbi:hypothetical protein [Nocardiopsis gilva]|nr:hypothetical protein [Nocardiopsis gilva]